jgi:ribose/xylose/arabinose/galactoside ABC-type transport system permease subunit
MNPSQAGMASGADAAGSRSARGLLGESREMLQKAGIGLALIVLIVLASVLSPYFLQPGNLLNVARQVSIIGIIAVGMTFVILTGGIDLSVGSILGLVAVVAAQQLQNGMAVPLVVALALLLGTALGLINGLGITIGGVPPFIMTLGMLVMARGAALTYAEGQPVSLGDAKQRFAWLGRGDIGGIPVPVFIFAIVVIAGMVILRYTTIGRYIYAIGSNREAARLAGIKVRAYTTLVYVISGLLAGLTALIWISRLTVGEPTAGTGTELEAIAVVVIGGTSLFGGEGGIGGTVIGAMIVGVLANVLNLLGVSPFTQQIVTGALIVLAVLFGRIRR